jgi:O-antigen/teichoic acid export membrane protein
MSDSSKAKKGVLWMGLLRGSTRGMSLIKNIILARLLSPSQFGIVGIAILVLGLLEMLTETGINVVLIQQKEDWRKYISSAFVVSIGRGILITLLLFLTSPLISFFFKSPEALPYLFIISLVPFIRGFINPSVVQFQKQLDFHKEFLFRFTLSFIDISVALTVAFLFASTASIVYGMIASAIFEVVLSQLLLDPRPRFSIKLDQNRSPRQRS